jgi:AAA domain
MCPDQAWLRATDELSRGKTTAIDKFRNIDFTRQSRNIYARMWLAYALAKLGQPSEIHDVIEIYKEVVEAEGFNGTYNPSAYWNLAIALDRVPTRTSEALDALLPLLSIENHPADSLDLALRWAMEQGRSDIQELLYDRCRHHEAHLLAALASARRGEADRVLAVETTHLRRLAALLQNPGHEFPHPAEQINNTHKLDQLVAEFARLQLLDAGVEWFRQRVTYPRERFSYKNWECLGELYERTENLQSAWYARRRSVQNTINTAKRNNKPGIASGPLNRLLTWAMKNGFAEQAARDLRRWWKDTTLSANDVAVWEAKLAPARDRDEADSSDGQDGRHGPAGTATQPREQVTGRISLDAARTIVDRTAPLFEAVSMVRNLVGLSQEVNDLLAAAEALGRPGSPQAVAAIRGILALAQQLDRGTDDESARAIDVAMREHGQVLQSRLSEVPLEMRGLALACLKVVQGLAAQLRGVPDLTLTMPAPLRMRLAPPQHGRPLETRLAVRIHNPAVEPAIDVRVAVSAESDELSVTSPPNVVEKIDPGSRAVVDFQVRLSELPASGTCSIRCHVSYRSVGIERAVHARENVPVDGADGPIPVTERFVIGAPVAATRVDLFQGRDRELAELKEAFAGGRLRRLYFVNGIRRVGKSSLMRHLGRVCSPDVLTLVVDFDLDKGLNDIRLIRELLRKAATALHEQAEFRELELPLPGKDEFELDAPWTVFENSLRLLQQRTGRSVLICFDELQEMVARIADPSELIGDSMLSWLRGKVQNESDLLFICTGSESYDTTKRRVDSRLWGNMQPYNVSFVDRSAMDRIATVPVQSDGVTWLPESLDLLWDLTEGHPWVTQVLAAHAMTDLNREHRRVVVPGDVDRAAETAISDASVSDLWWNEEEGLVTDVHRQVAFLILKHQPRARAGVTTGDLFKASAQSGIQNPGMYVDVMAGLELLTFAENGSAEGRWRIRGGFLERYLERLLSRVVSEANLGRTANAANQPLGVFLDVENIKRSLLRVIQGRPTDEHPRLERRLAGDELGRRLLRAAARHGNPTIKWAVANWHVSYLEGDQMPYKSAGFQPDIAGADKANASDHVLKEHIHAALRELDLAAFVIGTGDGDFQAIAQTLQEQKKYLVLWATRDNMSNAFGANLRSSNGMVTVEFLEDIIFGDDDSDGS